MNEMTIRVRTAQKDRHVEIALDDACRVEEILSELRQEWDLPEEHDFVLRLLRTGRQLAPHETLREAGVKDGDELELFPILVAGGLP